MDLLVFVVIAVVVCFLAIYLVGMVPIPASIDMLLKVVIVCATVYFIAQRAGWF